MTDDFEDDSFMADDLFLAEIDNIAAKAVKRTQSAGPLARPAFKAATTSARPALDSRTTLREGAKPAFSLARPTARTTSAPVHSHGLAGHGQKGSSSEAGPSRLAVESAVAGSSAKPTDNVPLSLEESKRRAAEARRAAIAAASSAKPPTAPAIVKPTDEPSRSTLSRQGTLSFGPGPSPINAQAGPSRPRPPPAAVPSSRLSRTSSGGHGGVSGVQIHLNFRREDQTTKGKRWDRTEYAQSGRRIRAKGKVVKGKAKGKRADMGDGSDVDMDEEDEEGGWDEPLAPDPKPLVDITKPYPPPKHLPVEGVIDKYIYPTNRPKRDYQFEIVQACFTDNCLVALPTGLGKTFVAGVVMLNFYRWFPTGKIVFLAPTKPLVNQQIEACQLTCGIPSIDAAVMTGSSVSAKERAKLWQERRVFYCTPQTLDNDLKARRLDPRDIVLAVFDEAHKASGSYAYTTILAFLMAHQPYFRVLALTATPGADVPKVQGVVDALHISRIEIREAEDPNISKYMNEKHTERHVVAMTDVIEGFRDRWAALMKPYIVKLVEKEILGERDLDAKRLKPFRVTHCRMQIMQDRNSGLKWAIGTLASLDKMARAMTHLLEFSLGMFHTSLLEIAGNMTASGKKATSKGNSNALRNNHEFQRLLRDVEVEMNLIRIGAQGRTKGDGHPKMTQTMELLLAHFSKADEDEKEHGVTNDTRAMVFCSFRECVMDIVDMLNIHSPVLRATRFVGQSQGKQDRDKGFNQKEQKKTINDFKEGKYNVLVSTSIGEEGLDIGEVDFVVIYDMPKQSIKLLQRIGRTGRKRAGQVHVLMSEGREDLNWDKAQDSHREIQEEILHSRNLELFEDVERLLPPGKFPQVEEMEMEVDPWDPENLNEKLAASKAFQKAEKKAKAAGKKAVSLASKMKEERASAPAGSGGRGADIPEDAPVGFKTVAELLREQQAKKAKKQKEEEEEEEDESGRDMDVDAEHGTRVPVTEKPKPKSRTKRKRTVSPVRSESDDDSSRGNELDERDPFAAIVPRAAKKAESSKKAVVDSAQRVKKADVAKPTRKQAKSRNAPSPDVEVDHDEFDDAPEFIDLSDRATNGAGGKANVVTRKEREILPPSSPQYDFGSADLAGIDLSHFDHASPSPPAPKHQTSKNGNRPVRPISVKNTIASVPTLMRSQIPSVPSSGQPLDFFNTSGPIRRAGPSRRGRLPSPPGSPSLSPSPAPSPHKKDTLGHVISSQNLPPSPNTDELLERAAASANCRNEESLATNGRLSPRTARLVGFSQIAPMDMDWELEDDEDLAAELFPNMLGQVGARGAVEGERGAQADEQLVEATPSAPTRRIGLARPIAPGQTRGPGDPSRDPLASGTHGNAGNMLPPPVPPRSGAFALSSPIVPSPTAPGSASRPHLATPTFEATQFPVRRAGVRRKVVVSSSEHGTPMEQLGHGPVVQVDSSPLAPVRQGRFGKKRRVAPPSEASSPPVPPQPRVRGARGAGLGKRQRAKRADVEQLMDINAELSGSASSDESGSDLDRETHSDQVFAGEEFAPTQAPKGYDQRAMHRAGLSTQAGSKAGLGFQPNKRKEAFLAKARKPVYVTDDEASGSENDYELGSFVVDDEDDLL